MVVAQEPWVLAELKGEGGGEGVLAAVLGVDKLYFVCVKV